jgi:serine/threonine-protein kinase
MQAWLNDTKDTVKGWATGVAQRLNLSLPSSLNSSLNSRLPLNLGVPLQDNTPLPLGTVVKERFKITAVLGKGGFGRTYLAEHLGRFGEKVVLKEFCPDAQVVQDFAKARELFEREAQVLYALDHPQIPKFLETIVDEFQKKPRLFLVQEYISGENYHQLYQYYYPQGMTEAEVKTFLENLLPVLYYLHSQNPPIFHRDITPDNIIRCQNTGLPKLIDFGAVKQLRLTLSTISPHQNHTCIGKPGYAPQEQLLGKEISPTSDLYALGATALVLLTGKPINQLLTPTGEWQWQSQVSHRVSTNFTNILNRLVAPAPKDRFSSAQRVLSALTGIPHAVTPPGIPTGVPPSVSVPQAPTPTPVPISFPMPVPSPAPVHTIPSKPVPSFSTPPLGTDPLVKVWQGFLSPEFRRFAKYQAIAVGIGVTVIAGPFMINHAWKNWHRDHPNTGARSTLTNSQSHPTQCNGFNANPSVKTMSDPDYNALVENINTKFWQQYPELKNQPLQENDPRKEDWCKIGNELLSQ